MRFKLKWTKAFRKAAGKEMVVDTTLQFAARRNIPTRYNRNHLETTLKAMERISEIRARRERAFYKKRMAGNKQRRREADRKLVEENAHLLPRERGSERVAREFEEAAVEEMENLVPPNTQTIKQKKKLKRRVDGGVDEVMEVD